ncbi:hypothetical protein BSZ39_06430 [Bowdeniella nasicola]|uniref:N-acetyltransferase domain-containing protein n=1 Tax=Bowdeniella nasicola TaxID=208480 RepID=A0A1Q5Q2N2_9ACTO|nr:GNAT family N-acetyltransferase [Bowdeniella nasicola]OKL53985.1 hypothetical protein BSZ39_06430 [Bowdeniella nasicola]
MIETRIITDITDIQAARGIRYDVFVLEQDVPLIMEVDARDELPTTIHALMTVDGEPVGTGRLLVNDDEPGRVHVGRLAIRKEHRGKKLGAELMKALEAEAVARLTPDPEVGLISELSAQEYAVPFYEKLGYQVMGRERYLDAGIWHHDMHRVLVAPDQSMSDR